MYFTSFLMIAVIIRMLETKEKRLCFCELAPVRQSTPGVMLIGRRICKRLTMQELPPKLPLSHTALLRKPKGSVVASNAPPRCRPSLKIGTVFFVLFIYFLLLAYFGWCFSLTSLRPWFFRLESGVLRLRNVI